MVFDNLLNSIFGPLLGLSPFFIILIMSLFISLIIVVIYKFTTDQSLMKDLKDEIKSFQTQMKTLKDNPSKMMKVQKKAMETNMKYMMQSFKPTLFTFLPIIVIFGWLSAHLAFIPLAPNNEFTITANFEPGTDGQISLNMQEGIEILSSSAVTINADAAQWKLKGDAGQYKLEFNYNDKTYTKDLLISDRQEYAIQTESINEVGLININIDYTKLQPLQSIPLLRSIPWINGFGWLGTYILFSIAFSMSLRKAFKVY